MAILITDAPFHAMDSFTKLSILPVLKAIKEQKTSAELASLYQVHPGQIRNWKAVVQKGLLDLFSNRRKGKEQDKEELIAELYRQIGQQKVDLDWLKKKSGLVP